MPDPATGWVVVVPVKGTADAKSRFGDGRDEFPGLAIAIARDSVAAVLSAHSVAHVIVVTSTAAAPAFDGSGAFVVVEERAAGLASAISLGLDAAGEIAGSVHAVGVAVLLGDLPALLSAELDTALNLARDYDRATVPDAEGTGTVLITAACGTTHLPAFGPGSNAAHRALGYVQLDVPVGSGLRNDADTLEQLRLLDGRLGRYTAAVLLPH